MRISIVIAIVFVKTIEYENHHHHHRHCYYAQIQWGKKPQNDSRVNHKNEMNEKKFHTRIAN